MPKPYGITLMLGDADHENTNTIVRELAVSFQQLGYQTQCVLASSIKDAKEFVQHLAKTRCVLIVSVAGMGLDLRAQNNLYNLTSVPVLTFLLDHPLHYWDRVCVSINNNPISCLSKEDATFVQSKVPQKEKTFVLNHGVNPVGHGEIVDKDIDLFFCATLRADPQSQRQSWAGHGAVVEQRLNDILDQYLSTPDVGLSHIVETVLRNEGAPTDALSLHPYYVSVDLYIRDLLRVKSVRHAKALNMVLAGPGWEPVLAEMRSHSIIYLGAQRPEKVEALMRRAKLVLNVMPQYHVSHERVFRSIMAGALPVTGKSSFYEAQFKQGNLILFDPVKPDFVGSCLTMLENEETREKAVCHARAEVAENHCWRHRCEQLIKYLNLPTSVGTTF